MNLNVKEITMADGSTVQLRLTSKAICAYALKHGTEGAPPLVSILNAIDDMAARIALFHGALRFPESPNMSMEGEVLLDKLTDAGYGREKTNALILELAAQAGLVEQEDLQELQAAIKANDKKLVAQLARFLDGNSEGENSPESEEDPAPTPMTARTK